MTALSPEVRAALTAGRLGHLVTIDPDGSPQVSIVWIGVRDDRIVVAHLGHGRKISNIARDPRVTLSLEAEGRTPPGLDNYLVVRGTAELTEGGAAELLQELAHVYLGPGVKFPPFDDPPPGHVISIRPDHIGGVGPWRDAT